MEGHASRFRRFTNGQTVSRIDVHDGVRALVVIPQLARLASTGHGPHFAVDAVHADGFIAHQVAGVGVSIFGGTVPRADKQLAQKPLLDTRHQFHLANRLRAGAAAAAAAAATSGQRSFKALSAGFVNNFPEIAVGTGEEVLRPYVVEIPVEIATLQLFP